MCFCALIGFAQVTLSLTGVSSMFLKPFVSALLLVASAFAVLPSVNAAPCGNSAVHTFTLGAGVGAYTDHQEAAGGGVASTRDTCTAVTPIFDPNDPTWTDVIVGDGDYDDGTGGGEFPTDQWECQSTFFGYPNGHHAGGKGAQYYATNLLLPMEWTAGTDGFIAGTPLTPGVNDCTGDGIISNDYNTNPYDCYSGVGGSWPRGTGSDYAEVWPNEPPYPAPVLWRESDNPYQTCTAMDGNVWVFLNFGVSLNGDHPLVVIDLNTIPPTVFINPPGPVTLSVPLQGTIYSSTTYSGTGWSHGGGSGIVETNIWGHLS
jgi:hypothetical protein